MHYVMVQQTVLYPHATMMHTAQAWPDPCWHLKENIFLLYKKIACTCLLDGRASPGKLDKNIFHLSAGGGEKAKSICFGRRRAARKIINSMRTRKSR
jgi:hypothetical protein